MKKTWTARIALLLIPILIGVYALAPAFAAQQASGAPRSPLQNIPITGTIVGGGTFSGTLDIVSFAADQTGTALVATGLVSGVLQTPGGNLTVSKELVTDIPVSLGNTMGSGTNARATTCAILNLTLGPLDLNLLGLVIHLNQVHLTIDAQSGPGNLLGNLLCAITHLLDGNPLADVLNQIVGLLNRVIDLLG
jgi:hypothetical protein